MTATHLRRALAASAAVAALALAGCAGPAAEPTTETTAPDASGAFPVTIEHAFGETEIPAEPERVVAWGWGSADASIALGVTPVAIPFQSYGGDDEGVLPWIREAVEASGDELPTILPDSEEPPYEAIAAADPDVILASYSGIDEDQYDLLSEIAPVVAYPETAWATPWRDVIEITGEALGRSDEATAVLDGIDATVAEAAAAHPEFEGMSIAAVWDLGTTFYLYLPADPRVEFLFDLGFVDSPSVGELDTGESTFYTTVSYEQLDRIESDVLLSYADTEEGQQTFLDSAPAQGMQQVQNGAVAQVTGTDLIASVSPPTALSATYGLDALVEALAAAVPE